MTWYRGAMMVMNLAETVRRRLFGWERDRKNVSAFAYVSTARPGLTGEEVDALVAKASARNRTEGITGMMIFTGRTFLQIVEGPHEVLYALYDRLLVDDRHSGMSLVFQETDRPRIFRDWGLRSWRGKELALVPRDLPHNLDPKLRELAHTYALL